MDQTVGTAPTVKMEQTVPMALKVTKVFKVFKVFREFKGSPDCKVLKGFQAWTAKTA
jgi:hypothetical protein